jgi:hypothetical protein
MGHGEGLVMLAMMLVGLCLLGLAMVGIYVGMKVAGAMRDQFDEMLPQRMVEYSGFVKMPLGRD